jgi:DNA-binding XRE family transcriptional regulator
LDFFYGAIMTNKHEPTAETRTKVNALASVGTPQDQIALVIGISKNTLIKHYRRELDVAMVIANAQVAQSLYQQAKSGNTSAAIFWMKCRAGWVDKQSIEHTGPNGGAIDLSLKVVFENDGEKSTA